MADIQKGELQDNLGNTLYPHTQSDIVFCTDGVTVEEKLAKYEDSLGTVTGKTDSVKVSDSNILATSKAVSTLNESLDNINIYVGTDKKLHFVDKDGADSVLPFSSTSLSGGYVDNFARGAEYYKDFQLPAGTYTYVAAYKPYEAISGAIKITNLTTNTTIFTLPYVSGEDVVRKTGTFTLSTTSTVRLYTTNCYYEANRRWAVVSVFRNDI